MPISLADGWNQVQFNLSDFTTRAYNRTFIEVVSLRINANIRLKRIYFAQKLINDDDLPAEYRLFYPLQRKKVQRKCNKHVMLSDENVPPQYEIDELYYLYNTPNREEMKKPCKKRPTFVDFADIVESVALDHASSQHSQEVLQKLKSSARTSQELLKKLSEEPIKTSAETLLESQLETKSQNSGQEAQGLAGSSRKSRTSEKITSNTQVSQSQQFKSTLQNSPQGRQGSARSTQYADNASKNIRGSQRMSQKMTRIESRDSQRSALKTRGESDELQQVYRTASSQSNDSVTNIS
ncbi:hypothetical protein O0L34_g7505 [Tuta absoluta]|nr:hypothetical protein O0L34_g7505 [Tuta absoluta]